MLGGRVGLVERIEDDAMVGFVRPIDGDGGGVGDEELVEGNDGLGLLGLDEPVSEPRPVSYALAAWIIATRSC